MHQSPKARSMMLARVQGFVVFVPGTKIGDNVKIKVDKVMRRFAIASVAE